MLRFEGLWQSPTGDMSHASNFRSTVRCGLPKFQCTAKQVWSGGSGPTPRLRRAARSAAGRRVSCGRSPGPAAVETAVVAENSARVRRKRPPSPPRRPERGAAHSQKCLARCRRAPWVAGHSGTSPYWRRYAHVDWPVSGIAVCRDPHVWCPSARARSDSPRWKRRTRSGPRWPSWRRERRSWPRRS